MPKARMWRWPRVVCGVSCILRRVRVRRASVDFDTVKVNSRLLASTEDASHNIRCHGMRLAKGASRRGALSSRKNVR